MSGAHTVRWCFHTTAMVADYERTRDALARLVGLRVLEDSRIDDPAIGRRGGMAWLGDNVIEVGEPIVDGGAVDRFVSRFGSGMSSIAVQVGDIDATVEFLAEHRVRVASRVGSHIVFTHPADTCGIVIEWFGDEEPLDPRFGAVIPPAVAEPVLDVQRMAFAGAVVDDPVGAAARLAELFGHGVEFTRPDAPPGRPVSAVSMGDIPLVLYPVPEPRQSLELWGHVYERAQTCNVGIAVPDLDEARQRLAAAQVAVLRDDGDQLVVPPGTTGGVTLVVVAA